jgi:hypothetical protein
LHAVDEKPVRQRHGASCVQGLPQLLQQANRTREERITLLIKCLHEQHSIYLYADCLLLYVRTLYQSPIEEEREVARRRRVRDRDCGPPVDAENAEAAGGAVHGEGGEEVGEGADLVLALELVGVDGGRRDGAVGARHEFFRCLMRFCGQQVRFAAMHC